MSSTHWRLRIAAGAFGVLLIGVAVYNYCRVYCCAPVHLRISGGTVCRLRSQMTENICNEVHESGIELEAVDNTNSESIAAAVDTGELDLGLVLGGFPEDVHPNVRQVAALGVDPLHLLVRRELIQLGPPSLELLRGRRVSLGERGSNGALLAESLMRFADIRKPAGGGAGDFQPEYTRVVDMHMALLAIRSATPAERATFAAMLPDAIFLVESLPSPIVDELVSHGGYQLVPLPYATALHLDNRRDRSNSDNQLESSRLEAVTIPAFTYGIHPAVPASDCPTFGLRLLLVANKKSPPAAVLRLLRALDSGIAQRYRIKLDTANHTHEFPVHAGAAAYAKGREPMMAGELLEPLGNLLSVIGAGGAGAFAIWGFLRGLRAVQPDIHLRQIDRIERLLRGDERDDDAPALPGEFIDFLERRLAEVKRAAIDDYAAGRLEGDEALVSILTMVADTRHLLVQRRKQIGQPDVHTRVGRLAEAA
jgi:TRAP-type uncharacterized transport system substrate-binding protein